jgi:HD-GYP domain-containing protein (c-di-GMP phosphodiesterase class II)
VVAALSFALDLTEDAVPGHAVRSCILGTRIGMESGLSRLELHNLYYALLLKDAGCSSNAARMCQILGGDERKGKKDVKTIDWTRRSLATLRTAWANVLPGSPPWKKVARILRIAAHSESNSLEMIALRCERGASIARKIGLGELCASAIHDLDEHWDGSGYPGRCKGEQIPILARILGVAQHLDVFAGEESRLRAMETLVERSGRWFDPELVDVVIRLDREGTLWNGCTEAEERAAVVAMEPGVAHSIGDDELDMVCEAFADVVDAKSTFTYRHSIRVKDAAVGIARKLGFKGERLNTIYRASLLHDLGKLRVPNSILDKPGKLDSGEWLVLQEHPGLTREILSRVPSFASIASIAGRHHERLDGSGYPDRLTAAELTLDDRVVAVADIYAALAEARPYRAALSETEIIAIMRKDVPTKLDPLCFDALLAFLRDEREANVQPLP